MKLKIPPSVLSSILQRKEGNQNTKGNCSALRAEQVERAAIAALAHWGHLRCAELARIIWPAAKYSDQLSQRLLKKLEARGLVMARTNAVGTRSFVLTRPGAAYAQGLGLEARHGLDLASVSGATFIHRSIASRYGIEMQLKGIKAFGEHAMSGSSAPICRDTLRRSVGKIPDLLLIERNLVNWVEVESSAKSKDELQKCLRIAKSCGKVFSGTNLKLNTVTFVCDSRLNHESRINRAANELWSELHSTDRSALVSRIRIAKVVLGPCSAWHSYGPPQALSI